MRRTHNNKKIILDQENNNQFIGISLGYDFTAEHEWGIDRIR